MEKYSASNQNLFTMNHEPLNHFNYTNNQFADLNVQRTWDEYMYKIDNMRDNEKWYIIPMPWFKRFAKYHRLTVSDK